MIASTGSEDGIWRLLYSSRIAIGRNAAEQMAAVQTISRASAERNSEIDVTGCLVFVDDCFVQVLEGPGDKVEQVFECICRDFRHTDVRLVDFVAVPNRVFADWEMALLCNDQDTSISLADELAELRFLVGINANQAVEEMRGLLAAQSNAAKRETAGA